MKLKVIRMTSPTDTEELKKLGRRWRLVSVVMDQSGVFWGYVQKGWWI